MGPTLLESQDLLASAASIWTDLCLTGNILYTAVGSYLKVGWYDDFAGWYLQYDSLAFKQPEIPL